MPKIRLPYGSQNYELAVPDEWTGWVAHPPETQPALDAQRLIRESLCAPIQSPRLKDLARAGMRVAIIVDDFTRKTPAHQALPVVLDELLQAGLRRQDIRIVLAPGTHRRMSQAEIQQKLGRDITEKYEVVDVQAADTAHMLYLGTSANGIPAWVNRAVVDADLRIGIGMITPHLDAGFSGGAKLILPGVCGEATVDAFHQASAFISENQLGREEAVLRQAIEEFVCEVVPLHFIVNLVLTLDGQAWQCVAGDALAAHRQGVRFARQVYGAPCPRRFPVVLANCAPYDLDLWQSLKGIYCGELVVADGGTLIIATAAEEGNSLYPLLPGYIGQDPQALIETLRTCQVRDAKQVASGVMVSRLRKRINLALVSTGLGQPDADKMGIPFFASMEQAVSAAVQRLPQSQQAGSLVVLPQAGVLYPILTESSHGVE